MMSRVIEGVLVVPKGVRFGIVVSRTNSLVTERLLDGAMDCLRRHGADEATITVVRVPGAFELPVVVQALCAAKSCQAIIALGCVIRGGTPHFDYVAGEASKGIAQVALAAGMPVGFGLLTCDSLEQALERAGAKGGNKGWEAALSAIELADLLGKIAKR
ncbi:MAG: 6,7-dimethyl-8-ribityllumazine synthase [Planctomycetota bacterium]|nr:6,7-dimethyl-8-ribityllumazine synthase [Planctomycetota bacterium]